MINRIHWQSPELFWITAIVIAAAVCGLILLYRPQLRPLPLVASWSLIGLRAIAIFTLALALLRPAVMLPAGSKDRDVIAVLVDRSRSMSIVDQGYSPPELVRLAAGLELLPPDVRSTDLAQLQQKVADLAVAANEVALAKSELDYARLAGHGIEPAESHTNSVVAMLNAAVRAAAESAPRHLRSRISNISDINAGDEIASVLYSIEAAQRETDEKLYQSNAVVREICDQLGSGSRLDMVRQAIFSDAGPLGTLARERQLRYFSFADAILPLGDDPGGLEANANKSSLAACLRQVRPAMSGQRLGAAIVFTDGRQTFGDPYPSPPISDVPVIMIPTGRSTLKDLSISRLGLPASAFVGDTIVARIDISATGYNGSKVEIVVRCGEQVRVAQVPVLSDSGHADIPIVIAESGPQEIAVTLTTQPGEITSENNTVRRFVKGISERMRTVLIAGTTTRDFQQLRQSLRRATGMAVVEQVVDTQRPCTISADELALQNVVVLCDVPAGALSLAQWEAIQSVAKVGGGGILIMCSDPAIIAGYSSRTVPALLLPWSPAETQPNWHVWPGEDPRLRIQPARGDLPELIPLSTAADVSRLRWAQLPPIFRFVAIPALKPQARPLLIERDSGLPVLSELPIGAGKSLLLGLDEIWRWRGAGVSEEQDRIWLQLLRYAAPKPFAVSDGAIYLDADQLQVSEGEQIRIRAMLGPEFPVQAPMTLEMRHAGEDFREIPANLVADSENEYESLVDELPAGSYDFRFTAGEHSVLMPVRVMESFETEMRNVSPDLDSMTRLAGSRGLVLPLDQFHALPERLAKLQANEPEFVEKNLWDSKYLFLFIIGTLGLEWAIRKRYGLA